MNNYTKGPWPAILVALLSVNMAAQAAKPIEPGKASVIDYWTKERRANAIPRDLVIDPRGLGYLRRPGGTLEPYGHDVAAQATQRAPMPSPFGKPSGGDTTPPTISNMDPASGATIGAAHTFAAQVTDGSGVASVSFKVQKDNSIAQSFDASPSSTDPDIWTVSLSGFTDGSWSWSVTAKDGAGKGGNTGSSGSVNFTVSTSSSGGGGTGGGDTVTSAQWSADSVVKTAAGRLYFEMPSNSKRTRWAGYVCSGTVATDGTNNGRSIIITAAHCVYDDAHKAFARKVLFIPDQDGTTGAGTDLNCGNDPLGCWVPALGAVDRNWTLYTFPNNIAWDYAYYVVSDSGAHSGTSTSSDVLDTAAGSLAVSFAGVKVDDGTPGAGSSDFTHALGYSYSDDPNFMYCAEDMTTEGAFNWWLPSCGLSGGSSGGPWVQPMTTGSGPIISVNSWGYTTQPGMAGPKLVGTSASCVFEAAKAVDITSATPSDGDAGKIVACSTTP